MTSKTPHLRAVGPTDAELLSLGKLHFLAGFCAYHKRMPAALLARIFHPAINHDCVRFFENENGRTAAALIWARLSDDVSARMLTKGDLPKEAEWVSGNTLWFLDILAPFGQGRLVARQIARTPPAEPFYFARVDATGTLRKVVRGDASLQGKDRIQTWHDLSSTQSML